MPYLKSPTRRGAIAPFAAVVIAVVVGMVAFAVDIGWIVVVKNQLQNAADAAALAAIDPLFDGYVEHTLAQSGETKASIRAGAMSEARQLAKEYANYHAAGDVDNLVLRDEDIEFGFVDAQGNYSTVPEDSTVFPNTVKVTLRRDKQANGSLGLFFGPVLGHDTADVTVEASTTAMGGRITEFDTGIPDNLGMLPMTYDIEDWNHFVQTGLGPEDKNPDLAANGLPQLEVYPIPKNKGNFGLLSLDNSVTASASAIDSWIHYGMTPLEVQAIKYDGLIPLDLFDAWDWHGSTGFKASNVMDVNQHIGERFLLPLFKAYSYGDDSSGSSSNGNSKGKGGGSGSDSGYVAGVGQGAEYHYNIVEFVGIRIMPVSQTNKRVVVQPAAVKTDFGVVSPLDPVGTTSTLTTTFKRPKLTG